VDLQQVVSSVETCDEVNATSLLRHDRLLLRPLRNMPSGTYANCVRNISMIYTWIVLLNRLLWLIDYLDH